VLGTRRTRSQSRSTVSRSRREAGPPGPCRGPSRPVRRTTAVPSCVRLLRLVGDHRPSADRPDAL